MPSSKSLKYQHKPVHAVYTPQGLTELQKDFYDVLENRAVTLQGIRYAIDPPAKDSLIATVDNPDGSRILRTVFGDIHIDKHGNGQMTSWSPSGGTTSNNDADGVTLEQLRNAQQEYFKIDSTVLGTVSDIIKTLPQPRLDQLKDGSFETCERLKALGLFKAADALHNKIREKTMGKKGYRLVSVDSIKRFLQRKVEIYNQARGKETAMPISDESYAKTRTVTAFTCDYYKGGDIGRFIWKETPIQDYAGIPPTHVLDALEKAKPDFDEIYVAEVVNLPDPILIGKLKDQIDSYYIPGSQWGNDVCLDDIV